MPLSFAGLISGMLTLVATPPNMVVDSALKQDGLGGFSFFSFTPFGTVILLVGIGYMLVARRLLGVKKISKSSKSDRRNFLDFIRDYKLAGRERRFRVRTTANTLAPPHGWGGCICGFTSSASRPARPFQPRERNRFVSS